MEAKLSVLKDVIEGLNLEKFHAPFIPLHEFIINQSSYLIIDVRTNEERNISTIIGSISKIDFENEYDKSYDKSKKIVCFDTVGYLSAAYATALINRDIHNAYYLVRKKYCRKYSLLTISYV